ncbi:MAG: rod shape-determining protein RodA [Prevotellaceae bacterium]|jgi:rod shape determining protein RodA|nr:rod shape-determining protein RodA [Prevotellaceae bacterium]
MYQRSSKVVSKVDWGIIFIWLALMAIGLVCIYATGYNEDNPSLLSASNRSRSQLLWICVACVIAVVVMVVEGRFYQYFATTLYAVALLLIVATLIFGREINGSRSWLSLGPLSLQPVEFLKIATALVLAKVISAHGFRMHHPKDLLLLLLVVVLPMGMVLMQHDTGSALVFASFIIMFYRAGLKGWVVGLCLFVVGLFIASLLLEPLSIAIAVSALCFGMFMAFSRRYKYGFAAAGIVAALSLLLYFGARLAGWSLSPLAALTLAHVALAPVAAVYAWWHKMSRVFFLIVFFFMSVGVNYSVDYMFNDVLKEHQRRRINDLLGIESDLKGWGYNVHQSKVTIGSGGLTGKGFLEGTQTKGNFVPEQTTDFIFCTIGEEWGFMGAVAVVGLYLLLLLRILSLAEQQKSLFAKMYGYGVASILFFHVAVNIGMTIGIAPVVGIPLPFISYGGSSLWAFTILIFVLLKLDLGRYEY